MKQRENAPLLRTLINTLLLVQLCVSLSGCALTDETKRVFFLAKRTTQIEPHFFEYVRSDRVAQREARLLAEQAWAEAVHTVPVTSRDYENGFLEGFADYLYRGGSGEPPVLPPRGYWNLRFLNQFGKVTVQEWYDGFRHGAQDCKARGIRDMWVVPSSLVSNVTESEADTSFPATTGDLWSADPTYLAPPKTSENAIESTSDADMKRDPPASPGPAQDEATLPPSESAMKEFEAELPDGRALDLDAMSPESDARSSEDQFGPSDADLDESSDPPTELIPDPTLGVPDLQQPYGNALDPDEGTDLDRDLDSEFDDDIFNLPTNDDVDDADVDLEAIDFGVIRPGTDAMSIRAVGPATSIPAGDEVGAGNQVRQTSGESVADPAAAPPVNTLRQQAASFDVDTPATDSQLPPMRLVFESAAPPPPVKKSPKRNADAAASPSRETMPFESSSSSPKPTETPVTAGRNPSRPHSLTPDTLFPESLPSLPLRIGVPRPLEQEPDLGAVDGLEPPPEFDVRHQIDPGAIPAEVLFESTRWTPEVARAGELPLRIDRAAKTRQDKLPMGSSLPPVIESTTNRATKASLKMRLADELDAVPGAPQPSSQKKPLPTIINRNELPKKVESEVSKIQWRIRD